MTTKTWLSGSGDWFASNVWTAGSVLTSPPVTGDTAVIYGGVTITAADAAVTGQGTLAGIAIAFADTGTQPTLDVSNEQFGAGIVIDTPFTLDAGLFIARGTVGFAGTLAGYAPGNVLTLDIESNAGLATFTNTGTVGAVGGGTLVVTGTTAAALVNTGALSADVGPLSVATALTNTPTGIVSATDAATLTLSGTVSNQGTIFASAAPGTTTYTTGTISISGSLTNTGLLYAAPFAVISASGGVANSGTITVAQRATLTLGGGVDNTAQLLAQSGTLAITGNITNEAAGTIGATGAADVSVAGALTNDGSIFVSALTGSSYSPGTLDITGSLVNAGNIAVPYFGVLDASGGVTNTASISVGGGAVTLDGLVNDSTLSSFGTLTLGGTADNAAAIAVAGGTLAATGSFTNAAAGTIAITGAGTLSATGTLANQGSIAVSALNGTLYSPGTVLVTGSLINSGDLSAVYFGVVTASGGVANSGTISNAGGTMTLGGGVNNTDAIVVLAGALGVTGTLGNSGTITDNGGAVTLGGAVADNGRIVDTAGTMTIAGALTGTGTVMVGDHVTLGGAVGTGQVIDFGTATDATLDLGDVGAFAGTIANITGHDIIDINAPATATTYDATTHVLTVLNGSSAVAAFTIASGATSLNAIPDGNGGTVLAAEQIGTPTQVENYMVQNDFNTIFPAPNNVPQTHGWPTPNAIVYYTFEPGSTLGAANESGFLQAMTLYSDIANISFATADASHPADLFLTSASNGQAETTYSVTSDAGGFVASSATIAIDTTVPGWTNLSALGTNDPSGFGGYGFLTVMHELGHVIGFGHPGPYNDGGVTANFLADQIFYTDTRQYTDMSYISSSQTGADWQSGTTSIHAQSPMLYDIGAAQMIYGANTLTLHGDDTFGFNSTFGSGSAHPVASYDFTRNTVPVVTLYDGGSNNTLDLSGFSAASYVNLNAGAFSSADGLTDNIAIAADTTINAAVGGAGNDVFTLNALPDSINGGGGVNTAVLALPQADYSVSGHAGTVTVTDTLNNVTDTLTNIQSLQFSNITEAAPCFLAGTSILTARGDVAVQALRPGEDRVVTRDGRLAPVVWLGWRELDAARHPRPADVLPVRVRAGAIAPGRPRRDLLLSPDHALALDGMLIPVRYLINGATIVQGAWAGRIAYYHVELDRHDVLLAEGLTCESYLDTGNRAAFANAGRVAQLHPAFAPDAATALGIWAQAACAPLVADGPSLAAARAHIGARAQALGYRLTDEPALCGSADGRPLPLHREGTTWHATLPARTRRVRLLSRVWVPLHMDAATADPRRLGVAIGALSLDGRAVARDDARRSGGWHAPEAGWRWTDGAAMLEARGARRLAFDVVTVGRYWLPPEVAARRASNR